MKLPELETLYTLYRADLYRYLCHLTHDTAEAEDLPCEICRGLLFVLIFPFVSVVTYWWGGRTWQSMPLPGTPSAEPGPNTGRCAGPKRSTPGRNSP